MAIRIVESHSEFEREPLRQPFGFKGGHVSNIWQSAVLLRGEDGTGGWGVGCQSVLWCDSRLFAATSEAAGNSLMFALTDRAAQMARGATFEDPVGLIHSLFEPLYEEAVRLTGLRDLRQTFLLNALVPFDNAAWMLYARENGLNSFDRMVPQRFRNAIPHRHSKVASVPVSSWSMPLEDLRHLIEKDGYFAVKFKLGSPGTQADMLEGDMQRLEVVHRTVGETETPHTENGKIPYYLDLNGRYESKESVERLLDHARKIGAFDRILLLEEPFPEEHDTPVDDLGVRVAADESAHTARHVRERIEMGYGAIALKPAAKTLSMTLEMALEAHKHGIPCFCADLTVNPLLVDWNKCVAARLPALPGLEIGLLEVNGHQNYRDWERMKSYHPMPDAPWIDARNGLFELDERFYEQSGGILGDSDHYRQLLADPV